MPLGRKDELIGNLETAFLMVVVLQVSVLEVSDPVLLYHLEDKVSP